MLNQIWKNETAIRNYDENRSILDAVTCSYSKEPLDIKSR